MTNTIETLANAIGKLTMREIDSLIEELRKYHLDAYLEIVQEAMYA